MKLLLLAAAAFSFATMELDGWFVSVSDVRPGSSPGTITGTVEVGPVEEGSGTVRSGGACLVAQLAPARPCQSDDECNVGLPGEWYGYCVRPSGTLEARTCWTRPGGGEYCDKGPKTAGTYALPEVPARVPGLHPESPRWMIIGCLADRANPFACAQSDTVHSVHAYSRASAGASVR